MFNPPDICTQLAFDWRLTPGRTRRIRYSGLSLGAVAARIAVGRPRVYISREMSDAILPFGCTAKGLAFLL